MYEKTLLTLFVAFLFINQSSISQTQGGSKKDQKKRKNSQDFYCCWW
jgi:hypothetical protein